MMDKLTADLLCGFLLALIGKAQPNAPLLFSALNSASYDRSAIAQGSLFVVFGQNIGPAQIVQASSFPLPAQLGGTAIRYFHSPLYLVYRLARWARDRINRMLSRDTIDTHGRTS